MNDDEMMNLLSVKQSAASENILFSTVAYDAVSCMQSILHARVVGLKMSLGLKTTF